MVGEQNGEHHRNAAVVVPGRCGRSSGAGVCCSTGLTHGKITVDVCTDRVVVSDTGVGIAAKDLQTVTQPHVRGSGSEGFGLGLSIVSRLCDRFGWQLEIQSVIGSGTTVQLIFCPTEK
jgi:signal transduction histidine kinase